MTAFYREIAEFPLEQAVEVYARLKTGQITGRAVLLPSVA
jgi:D-arabinose 1-dehydrogenase-like Zn-dependent alcohol dehydrogenase